MAMRRGAGHQAGPGGRRWPRRLLIALGVVVALLIVGRLVLDPLAARFMTRALAKNEHFQGSFSSVHVALIPPAIEVWDFKMIERPDGRWDEPLAYVKYSRLSVLWRQLLHGHLVAQARAEAPKFVALRQYEKKAEKAPEAAREFEKMVPIKLDLVEIADGELLLGMGKGKRAPQLWLHDIDLVANNLATTKALMENRPSTLHMTGTVQRSGKLRVDAEMDPLAKELTFSSKASLRGLKAEELYAFMAKEADLQAEEGTIDAFVEIKAKDGHLRGGVKPVLKNIEIRSKGDDLGDRIKAALADAAVELLSDDVPGRDAVATTIPIRGRIDQPDMQLLPTVLGVIRNAFVVALRSGFTNLPPPVANKKQGPIKQAWHALTDDNSPPKAQPDKIDQAAKQRAAGKPAEKQARRGRVQSR
jgi:hypothetical protein